MTQDGTPHSWATSLTFRSPTASWTRCARALIFDFIIRRRPRRVKDCLRNTFPDGLTRCKACLIIPGVMAENTNPRPTRRTRDVTSQEAEARRPGRPRLYPWLSDTCSVDGCESPAKTRGWCKSHYYRWLDKGSPTPYEPVKSLPGEEWRVLPGYDDRYSVSSLGRIRRDRPAPSKLLKPRWNAVRRYAALHMPGGDRYLHVLVAEAFLGPCPKGREVNHRDGNRLNNAVTNLEYITRRQNVRHALRIGLTRTRLGQQHLPLEIGPRRLTAVSGGLSTLAHSLSSAPGPCDPTRHQPELSKDAQVAARGGDAALALADRQGEQRGKEAARRSLLSPREVCEKAGHRSGARPSQHKGSKRG